MNISNFLLLTLVLTNVYAVQNVSDVTNLPFVTLVNLPQTLHIVKDNFRIVQTLNLKPVIQHINSIKTGFITVQREYKSLNDSPIYVINEIESKLIKQLERAALTIDAGLQLVPHNQNCNKRNKRELNMLYDEEVVNTHALFPTVGKLVNWITGSLSADAGQYINENYNNIKRLTQMSIGFAAMFNTTLDIERKHSHQLTRITKEIQDIKKSLNDNLNQINRKLAYEAFLQNLIIATQQIQKTIDDIFHAADLAERNQMGSIIRDSAFIDSVSYMLDYGTRNKDNILYLLKLSAKTNLEVCHWEINFKFTFPVLEAHDYVPKKVLPIPKLIKGKYFEINNTPHVITWSEKVYSFTFEEYQECDTYNTQVFCRIPMRVENIIENCIFGLAHGVFWDRLANRCTLRYIENPPEFVEFSTNSMFYFVKGQKTCMMICPKYSKTIRFNGGGTIRIPTGCKVRCAGRETFTLGHFASTKHLEFEIQDDMWKINISNILPLMTISNVKNVSTLWEDTVDEELEIAEGVKDSLKLLEFMEFTPSGVNFTLWTLIGYAVITTIVVMVIIYFMCLTNGMTAFKSCCKCGKDHLAQTHPTPVNPGHV